MKLSLYHKLMVFHIFLGIVIFVFKPFAKVYFLYVAFFFIYKIFNVPSKKKILFVLIGSSYIVGLEVFLRMNNGTFFYEGSKYLVMLFVLIGLFTTRFNNKGLIYVFYLLLLIPAIFVAVSNMGFETNIKKAVAFNLSGPVCLGLFAFFCYGKSLSFDQFKLVLLAIAMPVISMTTYLFFFTPDLRTVVSGTGSNFATSGGFGPNQVATALGLGMFVMASRFFMSKSNRILKIIDLAILVAISFRAIVTFSRGGVITAVVMILCFLLFYFIKVNLKFKRKILFSLVAFLGISFSTWVISSVQTGGFIDKRYANQDAAGREKADITTGRENLILFEIKQFIDNPILGVGVGKVKDKRLEETGILAASHNELGRIIAEHGSLGLIALLILLIIPLFNRLNNKSNIFFYSLYLFWFLTINHSAMRIAAPAFIYGLCLLTIKYEKPPLHRKQIITQK
ncbi:O-antigen ligase family protein [Flavobacteriaceae bacterium MHTCC 0001]